MKYNITQFEVKAGQEVTLIMNNTATSPVMKHNIVVLASDKHITEIGIAAITAPNNIPEHKDILAYTPIADIGESQKVTFMAPEKKGKYPYLCTYPGHYVLMRGVMIVK